MAFQNTNKYELVTECAFHPANNVIPFNSRLPESGYQAHSISPVVVAGLARAAEFCLLTVLGLAIAHLYVDEPDVLFSARYGVATVGVSFVCVAILELFSTYRIRSLTSVLNSLPYIALSWTMAFASLVGVLFFLKMGEEMSRVWMAAWFLSGVGALTVIRLTFTALLRYWARSGRLYQRAVIYGTGSVTDDVIEQIETDSDSIIRVVGIFDDRSGDRDLIPDARYPRQGGVDELIAMSRTTRLDLVIVALPMAAEERLGKVARRLSVLPADIKLPAQVSALRFTPRTYSQIGSLAMIDLYDKPLANWDWISKWVFDKVIGTVALVLLAPVLALVALAVKLDSRGPVLFRQKRYGFNNELIEVFKFRSMYVDRCDASASNLVTKDDPRVTPVGRIIRKTSLDELPQLFNVLLGNLSLVGPRPHALQAKAGTQLYDDVVDGYFARHRVKPGITGWAQVNGWRGETDTEEKILKRVEHDHYYIDNWSVFFDLYILLKTPYSLLKSENAY